MQEKKDLYVVFIDLVKVFDSVDRGALMNTLIEDVVNNPMRSLIWNIHSGAEGVLEQKYKFLLERGVRQGGVLGPNLFNLISGKICRDSLKYDKEVLGHLAYADDLVLLASSQSELKEKLALFNEDVVKAGMEISIPKTEIMVVSSEATNKVHSDIGIDGKKLKMVSEFNYRGSKLTTDTDISKVVASNCKKARLAIVKLRAALVSGTLRLKTKCRLIKILVKPFLLYGLENSITRKTDLEKKSAVLNKALRMVMKINDKRVMPVKELSEAVPLKDIETELANRRANLWVSLNNLKVPELLSTCKSRNTYTED